MTSERKALELEGQGAAERETGLSFQHVAASYTHNQLSGHGTDIEDCLPVQKGPEGGEHGAVCAGTLSGVETPGQPKMGEGPCG